MFRSVIWLSPLLSVCLWAGGVQGGDLVQNGTFEGGWTPAGLSGPLDGLADQLPVAWSRYETFTGGIVEDSLITVVPDNGPSAPGTTAANFRRLTPLNASGDFTSIYQALNVQARRWHALRLSMDVQVNSHDLTAGGWSTPAFEWPVVAQVTYLDTTGATQVWRFGWYLADPGDGPPGPADDPGQGLIPIYRDMQVSPDAWVANQFDLLSELPKVKTITQLLVGGSGWNFQGKVDNVSLTGTLQAAIDIKPGGRVNPINVRARGVVPVAILGRAWFDVRNLDQSSLNLEGAAPKPKGKSGRLGSLADINGDQYRDLILQFPIQDMLQLQAGDTSAELTGLLKDGTPIFGSDSIRIIDPKGLLLSRAGGTMAALAPEPGMMVLLAIGAGVLLRRRRG